MKKTKQPVLPNTESYPKARTPEARDNQLIALSYDLVEARLREGTATSQETTFFLKLAAEREEAKLKREIMEEQRKLYMLDDIHPTKAGYWEWWLEPIEAGLINAIEK